MLRLCGSCPIIVRPETSPRSRAYLDQLERALAVPGCRAAVTLYISATYLIYQQQVALPQSNNPAVISHVT